MLPNLRDVGGVPAGQGMVRTGVLYRSAMPAVGDRVPGGLTWPPALVVDLRSPAESGEPHPLALGPSSVVNLPLLSALRPEVAWPDTLGELYLAILTDAADLLVDLIAHVGGVDGPTLIHCAAGKDRTGVAVALLLRLLGVEREHVVADYLLTREAEDAILVRLGESTVPPHFLEVPVGAIEAVLDVWDRHDGGAEGWYLTAGGSHGDLGQLRKRMID